MADNAFPFDVKFTLNGTEYGFMLTSPDGQSKQIGSIEQAIPKDPMRINTRDIFTHQDYDPIYDTPFVMTNFAGGLGQLDALDDEMYLWGSNVVTHADGRVYPAPAVASTEVASSATETPTGMTTWIAPDGTRYDFMWVSDKIYRRDASNDTNNWVLVFDDGDNHTITDFKIMNGIGLIATPDATDANGYDFRTVPDLTVGVYAPEYRDHTPFSEALGKPKYFQTVRGTLYAAVDKNKIFFTTDPTVDGWTGPIDTNLEGNVSGAPGDTTYPITGLMAIGDFLFVIKQDAVYSIDSQQDVLEVIWQWKDKPSDYNFKYHASGADLFIYTVGQEIWIYDPTTGVNYTAGISMYDSFSVKELLGLAADNRYIYVLAKVRVDKVRSADTYVVLRGFRRRTRQWVWECVYEDTSPEANVVYGPLHAIPSGVDTRIYFWQNRSANDTQSKHMNFPPDWDESQAFASSSSFSTDSPTLYTSISKSGYPGFYKRHLYMNLDAEDISASAGIEVAYSTDEGSTFTVLGTATASPFESNFSDVVSKSIILRFRFTGTSSLSAILRNFDHHQRVRYKYIPTNALKIRLADGLELRNKSRSGKSVTQLWNDLVTLRSANDEIAYKDFLGNEYNVSIDMITVNPILHEGIGKYELEASVMITRADRGQ